MTDFRIELEEVAVLRAEVERLHRELYELADVLDAEAEGQGLAVMPGVRLRQVRAGTWKTSHRR